MDKRAGILIGGSPSTGSSVLVNILNRHKDLLAGPETYLFIHPKLYTDWLRSREYLVKPSPLGGLKSVGWFRRNGADLMDPFYGWEKASLDEAIRSSPDFPAFADEFFYLPLERKGAKQWVEKSPSNSLCFDHFLKSFPGGKVIFTARDPYDTIASLVARGYTAWYATAAYLINAAFAMKAFDDPGFFCLKYEEWVRNPESALPVLFYFLGLEWNPSLLIPEEGEGEVKMEGWLHNEKGRLQPGSVGRFRKLKKEDQDRIRYAVEHMRLRAAYKSRYQLPVEGLPEIMERLGYDLQPPERSYGNEFELLLMKDRLNRIVRLYPTGWWWYPVRP